MGLCLFSLVAAPRRTHTLYFQQSMHAKSTNAWTGLPGITGKSLKFVWFDGLARLALSGSPVECPLCRFDTCIRTSRHNMNDLVKLCDYATPVTGPLAKCGRDERLSA